MSLSKKMMANEKLKFLNFICTSRSDYRSLNSNLWNKAKILNWIYLSFIFMIIIVSFTPLYFTSNKQEVLSTNWMKIINILVFSILVIDYILRWITYPVRIRTNSINPLFFFIFTSSSIFVLLSLVSASLFLAVSIDPSNTELIRTAKVLAFLKIFRLILLMNIIPSFKVLTEEFIKSRVIVFNLLSILSLIVLIISIIIFSVEAGQSGKINNFGDAVYYCFITVTSVGFGDLVCVTPEGKFLTGILALIGTITLSIPFGIVVVSFTSKIKDKFRKYEDIDLTNVTTLAEVAFTKIFKNRKTKKTGEVEHDYKKIIIIEGINKDKDLKLYLKIVDLVGGEENIQTISSIKNKLTLSVIDSRKISQELDALVNLLDLKIHFND